MCLQGVFSGTSDWRWLVYSACDLCPRTSRKVFGMFGNSDVFAAVRFKMLVMFLKNNMCVRVKMMYYWKSTGHDRENTGCLGSWPLQMEVSLPQNRNFMRFPLEFTCFGEKHYVRFSAPLLFMISVTCPERGNLRDPCRLGSLKLSKRQFANVLGNWWKVASASIDDQKTKQVMILWCSAHLFYVYN